MSILITILLSVWMIVALLMVLVILMQRPKSEGLGAAFGGGVTENIFGAQTTNVLVKFTGYLAGIFFVVTFLLSILYAKQGTQSSALRQELLKTQAAAPGTAQPSPASSAPVGASPVATPSSQASSPVITPSVAPAASAAPSVQPKP